MNNLYTGSLPPQTEQSGHVLATVAAIGGGLGMLTAAGMELFDVDYIDSVVEAGTEAAETVANMDLIQGQQLDAIESALDYTGQEGGVSTIERLSNHLSESWNENVSFDNVRDTLTEGGIFEQEGGLSQAEFREQLVDAITPYDINAPELQNIIESNNSVGEFSAFLENDSQQVLDLGNSNLRVAKLSDGEHIAIVDLEKTAQIDERNAGLFSTTFSTLTEDKVNTLRAVSENPLHDMPQSLLTGGTVGAAGGAALAGVASALTPKTDIADAQYQQALQERRQIGMGNV